MKKGTRIVMACLVAVVTAVSAGCGNSQTASEAPKKSETRVVKHLMGEVTIPADQSGLQTYREQRRNF